MTYAERVLALEAVGLTTSDAQAVADAEQHPVLTQTRCTELCKKMPHARFMVASAAGNPNWEVICWKGSQVEAQEVADRARGFLGYNKIIIIKNPLHPLNQ